MNVSAHSLVRESLRDFRRTWPQLVLTDLLARVLAILIIAPLVGLLGKLFLWRTATGVVTDEAIVSFLLHPFGMASLVVMVAVSLGVLFAETGQLMVIAFGAIEERRVTWLDALFYSFRRAVALVHLAGGAFVRLLLISAPFLAVIGGIYWLLARNHDINYYMARKPPEFIAVLVAAGVLLAVLALLIANRIAGWLLAVPMVLFEGAGGRRSLQTSESATAPFRGKIMSWLLGWLAVTVVVGTTVAWLVGHLGSFAVSLTKSNITVLLVTLSLVIIISFFANLAVTVFMTVFLPLLVVRLYRAISGPGELRPAIAPTGSLGEKTAVKIPGKLALATLIGVGIVTVVGVSLVVDDPDWVDPAQIIAHRGSAWVAPENTLAAFESGIANGADWLELEVRAGVVDHGARDQDLAARGPSRHPRGQVDLAAVVVAVAVQRLAVVDADPGQRALAVQRLEACLLYTSPSPRDRS